MGKYVRGVLWGLFFLFLGIDLYAWGGLAITPDVGKQLREQASLRSPLAASYMFAGRKTIEALGRRDQAVAYAARHFRAEAFSDPGPPQLVVERFHAAQSATASLAYYGAPLLLVLSLVLHVRRQKPVRSFGRRG